MKPADKGGFRIFVPIKKIKKLKFQIGDKVIVKHSNEEGEVIDIINREMLMVEVRGVRFPAYVDQLNAKYLHKKQEATLKGKIHTEKSFQGNDEKNDHKDKGVWITFFPTVEIDIFGDEVVEHFKIHLSNRTKDILQFKYQLNIFANTDFELSNQVNSFDEFYIHDVSLETMNDNPVFWFEFNLLISDKKKAPHYEASLKLKAKQLFTKIEEIRKAGKESFSYQLFENYPDKQERDDLGLDILASKGYKVYDASRVRQNLESARSVVDLHIDKLTDNYKHLSNFEIVTIQLKNFEKYFELAYIHRMPNLIIIHGVGTGKLRDEIHDILKLKSEVKTFVNQYHPLYGFGATEIYFQY